MEPGVSYYKPAGVPMRDISEVVLTVDELEAMRLAHLEGLYQEEVASRMGVSRQTVGNILGAAHRKVANCLVNGKALRIEGGVTGPADRLLFECSECSHQWEIECGSPAPRKCPHCSGGELCRLTGEGGSRRRRCCRKQNP